MLKTSRTGELPILCVPIIVVNAGENKEKIAVRYRARGRECPLFIYLRSKSERLCTTFGCLAHRFCFSPGSAVALFFVFVKELCQTLYYLRSLFPEVIFFIRVIGQIV